MHPIFVWLGAIFFTFIEKTVENAPSVVLSGVF